MADPEASVVGKLVDVGGFFANAGAQFGEKDTEAGIFEVGLNTRGNGGVDEHGALRSRVVVIAEIVQRGIARGAFPTGAFDCPMRLAGRVGLIVPREKENAAGTQDACDFPERLAATGDFRNHLEPVESKDDGVEVFPRKGKLRGVFDCELCGNAGFFEYRLGDFDHRRGKIRDRKAAKIHFPQRQGDASGAGAEFENFRFGRNKFFDENLFRAPKTDIRGGACVFENGRRVRKESEVDGVVHDLLSEREIVKVQIVANERRDDLFQNGNFLGRKCGSGVEPSRDAFPDFGVRSAHIGEHADFLRNRRLFLRAGDEILLQAQFDNIGSQLRMPRERVQSGLSDF